MGAIHLELRVQAPLKSAVTSLPDGWIRTRRRTGRPTVRTPTITPDHRTHVKTERSISLIVSSSDLRNAP